MIYHYIVTFKNTNRKYIDIVSILLAGISALLFLYQQVRSGRQAYIFGVAFLLIAAGLTWNIYHSCKKKKAVSYSRVLLVAGVTWFAMPFLFLAGIPILVLALLEKPARLSLEIGFADDRIVFNTLIRRKYSWSSLNNVLLKDGILTLDFKNNRLFQKETIDDDDDADEDEFNEYCKERLRRAVLSPHRENQAGLE